METAIQDDAGRFFRFLEKRLLTGKLPGVDAQARLSPRPVHGEWSMQERIAPVSAHPSSVLLLVFYDEAQRLSILLTLRNRSIRHGGEISFPGGRKENEETARETAIRETKEEIGVTVAPSAVLGELSPLYVPYSDNNIIPLIAGLEKRPNCSLNRAEVEEVFGIPLEKLLQKQYFKTERWRLDSDTPFWVPFWQVHDTPLWGATAMILNEFLELYKSYKNNIKL